MIYFHEMSLGCLTGTVTRGNTATYFAVCELTDVSDQSRVDFERSDMIPSWSSFTCYLHSNLWTIELAVMFVFYVLAQLIHSGN